MQIFFTKILLRKWPFNVAKHCIFKFGWWVRPIPITSLS